MSPRHLLLAAVATGLLGCAQAGGPSEPPPPPPCEYPEDSVEPMEVGEVITPYFWQTALHADGRDIELSLGEVYCNEGSEIDWSPFDVLLFISYPVW